MKKAIFVVLLCLSVTASAAFMPLYDPYAVHVDGTDTLEGNWSLGGFDLTNGGTGTFTNIIVGDVNVTGDLLTTGTATLYGDILTDRWLERTSNTFVGVDVCGGDVLEHTGGNEGYYNSAFGYGSLYSVTTGYLDLAFGYGSLYSTTTGYSNAAFGSGSLFNNNGNSNIALGAFAGYNQTAASNLLIIDNKDRGSTANELAHSLIYGAFHADGAASQTLKFNAAVTVNGTADLGDTTVDSLTLDLTQDYIFAERGNSLAIQSQTAATSFALELFNKDGDGTDGVYVSLYGIGTPASIDPRERLILAYQSGGPNFEIYTETLNGTVRPLSIYTGTNTTQLVLNIDNSIDMSGALAVTGTVSGATGSVFGTLTLTDGDITDSGGAINFSSVNVGIAVAAPKSLLHLSDGSTSEITTQGAGEGLIITGGTTAPMYFECVGASAGNQVMALYYQSTQYLHLGSMNDVGSAWDDQYILSIHRDGNIGINDATPGELLDVNGNANVTGVYKVDDVQVVSSQQAHIADADAAVAAAAGDPPTQAEFNALVTAYNDLATKFNTLLTHLDADAGHGLLAGAP